LCLSAGGAQASFEFVTKWGGYETTPEPGHLAVDASGNVYVVDLGNALIRKFAPDGTPLTQWAKPGLAPGELWHPEGITVAGDTVYVTDEAAHLIQRFTSAGSFLGEWGIFGEKEGQLWYPQDIAADAFGNLYIVDCHPRVHKFTCDGGFLRRWGSYGAGPGEFAGSEAVAVSSSGDVYVADSQDGSATLRNDRIQRFTSDGAFLGMWGSSGTGNGQFDFPGGVAVEGSGAVYVADLRNDRIQKFTSDGTFVKKWGSHGSGNGQFDVPVGVAVDGFGHVYVGDFHNQRVQKFTRSGAFLAAWAGQASDGRFHYPFGVAVSASGNVYVTDTQNHRIQKFTANGTFLTKWGCKGTENGQFDQPQGLAVDGVGNVYVADTVNDRIQKFTADGAFLTKWGSQGTQDGQFYAPVGVAAGASGDVYVTDPATIRVQRFTSDGAFVGKWGSYGTGPGAFREPQGLAVDALGNVYVADSKNSRIQKFTPDGVFMGEWGSKGTEDGQFRNPIGVAVDGSGNVYVAEREPNPRVQQFTSNGVFLTKWGSEGTGDGQFDWPCGVAADTSGNVYVADCFNHRIQKFAPVRPRLQWVGVAPYETDGVDPDSGDPNSTTFTFKVKYRDPSGAAPRRARCLLQRKDCGQGWRANRSLALTKESGDIATGAIYSASTQLPNLVVKYRFWFKDGAGADVLDEPATFHQGPLLTGRPWVCWTGGTGFEADGVDPDSAPPGTSFKFQVQYADSAGDAPITCQLNLRRNGKALPPKALSAASGGDLRLGKVYRASVTLTAAGAYEYRFCLADASGNALGPPSQWTAGPTLTGSAAALVTSLTALPTAAGVQATFTLAGAAPVTATVLNTAGRPVDTLAAERPLEAGTHTLVWDGNSATGLRVPPGMYLLRVTARAEDGRQSQMLAAVRLR